MIGFGKDNEEFGKVAPSIQSFEEMKDEEGFADNSLLIRLVTWTGIKLEIRFPSYIMFLTRNESYTAFDGDEVRQGTYLIVFSKSHLRDFYEKCGFELEFVRENKSDSRLNKYFYIKYLD